MTKRRTYPRRGLHGEVVHAIGLRILRGELQPGDPLPTEEELKADGFSRTVLREAVRVLAAKGLVHAQPKTGTRVRPRSEWNIVDRHVPQRAARTPRIHAPRRLPHDVRVHDLVAHVEAAGATAPRRDSGWYRRRRRRRRRGGDANVDR